MKKIFLALFLAAFGILSAIAQQQSLQPQQVLSQQQPTKTLQGQVQTVNASEDVTQGQVQASLSSIPLAPQIPTQEYTAPSKPLQAQAEGGESSIGVLGGPYNFTGAIREILPGSDLLRFGIHPGDKYLGINGHRFNRFIFIQECRGIPGSIINLTILHDGQIINIAVKRMDSRIANQQYRGWGLNYRWCAAQTKYW